MAQAAAPPAGRGPGRRPQREKTWPGIQPPPAVQPAFRGLEGVTRSGRGRTATPEGSPVHRRAAAGVSCAAAAGRSPRLPPKHSASFSGHRKSVKGLQVQAAPAGGRLIFPELVIIAFWQKAGVRGCQRTEKGLWHGTAGYCPS